MTGRTGIQKFIGAGRRLSLLALLAMVFAAPMAAVQAEGSAQCPIPQKRSNTMNEFKPSVDTRAARPPIDVAGPVRTETATFAMG
ncbi:MAG: hypothetical protein LLG97_14360 [Deltaproteobacteria bacterium]|nr:hypothetical protein [Deltaproteobacteria bacterium]